MVDRGQSLLDDLLETVSYDGGRDWREMPELGEETDEELRAAGGPGSGNFGHAGRPGEVGGSAPEDGSGELTPEQQYEQDKKDYLTPGEYAKLPPGIVKWKVAKRKAEAEAKRKAGEIQPKPKEQLKVEPKDFTPTVGQREKAIADRYQELMKDGRSWSEAMKQVRAEDEDRFGPMPANSLHSRTEAISDRQSELRGQNPGMGWEEANKLAKAEDVAKWGPWVQPEDVATTVALDKSWSVEKGMADRAARYPDPLGNNLELKPRPQIDPQEQTVKQQRFLLSVLPIAAKMGHDPNLIVVRDYEGRTFQLNGQTLTEGGHYNPMTGMIELNAAKNIDDGTTIHEIQHAQFSYVQSRASEEQTILSARWSREQAHDFRGTQYFTKDGKVLAKYRKEVEAQVPHLATFANAGLGNRQLGIKPDIEGMHKDDGVSDYSAMYWKQAADKEGTATGKKVQASYLDERAVDETLSEIARREMRVTGYYGDSKFNIPSRFHNLGQAVSSLYKKDPAAVKKFFVRKQQYARTV